MNKVIADNMLDILHTFGTEGFRTHKTVCPHCGNDNTEQQTKRMSTIEDYVQVLICQVCHEMTRYKYREDIYRSFDISHNKMVKCFWELLPKPNEEPTNA